MRNTPSGFYWSPVRQRWTQQYVNLPVYGSRRIVLIPKAAVRFQLAVDHQAYYNDFVLEYLRMEHYQAGSALVETLKNGREILYKKALKKHNPCSKDFLFEFSQRRPDVLEDYKKSLPGRTSIPSDEELEASRRDAREIDFGKLVKDLEAIPEGNDDAARYHNFALGALETIFHPQLRNPKKEEHLHEGRKRIDIVFDNGAKSGFFARLHEKFGIVCPLVIVECKNYASDPKNPELDQLTGRFSPNRGKFGILVCRSVSDKEKVLARCRDAMHDDRGHVLVIDDIDIKELLGMRAARRYSEIDNYMGNLLRRLVM